MVNFQRTQLVFEWVILTSLLYLAPSFGFGTQLSRSEEQWDLWQPNLPLPTRADLSFPEGAIHVVVHRAGSDRYHFLHDAAIVEHEGTLFVGWYNCPEGEIQGESLIRGRRSRDGGLTWSEVEVIASDTSGQGILYVPVAFLSHKGRLCAFVSHMTGHDLLTGWEMLTFEGKTTKESPLGSEWKSRFLYDDLFLPNSAPVVTEEGHFLMGGRMAERPGEKPLVPAIARNTEDLRSKWEVLPLLPDGKLPDGRRLAFPETTLIVENCQATALVRAGSNESLLFLSEDCGRTWSGPHRHNLPMGASKIHAGVLSSGQRFVIFNTPTEGYRELLTLAVSAPGEKAFSRMWKIQEGPSEQLGVGPEWSYPSAIEYNGSRYVVYTSEKHHCVMTIIPIESLTTH